MKHYKDTKIHARTEVPELSKKHHKNRIKSMDKGITLNVLNSTSAYSSPNQVHVSKTFNKALEVRQLLDLHNSQGRSAKLAKVVMKFKVQPSTLYG